ncbi:MAG: hypothetical protein H0U27_14110, partial [Nitrosopumilus sp.]|nr:hypothetical protein [Nitrosopumilus sp.]
MKSYLFLIHFFLFVQFVCGQNIFFEKEYGPGEGKSIEKSINGPYYLIGASTGIYPNQTAYYFYIDEFGDTVKTFSFSNSSLNSIAETGDGFVIVGDSCCSLTGTVYKVDT